ncbi:hypothetical protein [Nostoc sp. MG11]|nr:hypothetical protein [Nostoc sp. MG11]
MGVLTVYCAVSKRADAVLTSLDIPKYLDAPLFVTGVIFPETASRFNA